MWSAVIRPALVVVAVGGSLFVALVIATFCIVKRARRFKNGACFLNVELLL